jgi:hypothetical protein
MDEVPPASVDSKGETEKEGHNGQADEVVVVDARIKRDEVDGTWRRNIREQTYLVLGVAGAMTISHYSAH